jgi:hypothetical protein
MPFASVGASWRTCPRKSSASYAIVVADFLDWIDIDRVGPDAAELLGSLVEQVTWWMESRSSSPSLRDGIRLK